MQVMFDRDYLSGESLLVSLFVIYAVKSRSSHGQITCKLDF